jgi:hypothetical protein
MRFFVSGPVSMMSLQAIRGTLRVEQIATTASRKAIIDVTSVSGFLHARVTRIAPREEIGRDVNRSGEHRSTSLIAYGSMSALRR